MSIQDILLKADRIEHRGDAILPSYKRHYPLIDVGFRMSITIRVPFRDGLFRKYAIIFKSSHDNLLFSNNELLKETHKELEQIGCDEVEKMINNLINLQTLD